MSIPSILLGVIILLIWSKCYISFYEFSSSELAALQAIYNSTNGQDWIWSLSFGIPWDFSSVNATNNPCTADWQGVFCSSDCKTEPCSVEAIFLVQNNMAGTLPNIFDNLPMLETLTLEINYISGKSFSNFNIHIFFLFLFLCLILFSMLSVFSFCSKNNIWYYLFQDPYHHQFACHLV